MVEAKLKTQKTKQSPTAFLNGITDEGKRRDAKKLLKLMQEATGEKPVMWGESIIGFGEYHYRYKTGWENDWMAVGFSPRAKNLTLYIMPGYTLPKYQKLLKKLGPHSLGKSGLKELLGC